ncbi:MAG: STAS domain-containing protein [Phycisphaerae bacterium]|nr:STAS domain-containing protein [Phycisphaerae bacterium]MDW8262916.1 STAS domain-containing protein [Phycisphaerales bacterium]
MPENIPPISVVSHKDIRIVEFTNNKILDEANIEGIRRTIDSLIDETDRPKLLLDFGAVDHLSSAALGMLINCNNRVKARNGQLRLANIKPQILEVFVITKLNKLFKILPTREEALASFMAG